MKLLKTASNHEILFYDSIHELPMCVMNEFNKYLLMDIGIGSKPGDITKHHSRLYHYLSLKDIENAAIETQNLHMSIYNTIEKFNSKYYSFAVMVAKINNKKVSGYTMQDIEYRINELSELGVTDQNASDVIEAVKKKLILS